MAIAPVTRVGKSLECEWVFVFIVPKMIRAGRMLLNAMFDFADMKDRAMLVAGGEPFAIAGGDMREVETPPRPGSS